MVCMQCGNTLPDTANVCSHCGASQQEERSNESKPTTTLSLLLAAAMFVLVIDTSLMNVSISSVVSDLNTTVSGVQSAIALEALVSAAFILVGSKISDFIGRRKAYILGLLGYGLGAIAMTFTQNLLSIIIFWAIIGGLGAALLLPAMQALIHGNFEDGARKKTYALVGAAAAIAAAIGPLLGGVITTFLSWRLGFALEALIIAIVLLKINLVTDVVYTGQKVIDKIGALLSAVAMGGIVLGILIWQEGGERVFAFILVGAIAMFLFYYWITRQKKLQRSPLIDPELFRSKLFTIGITQQMFQQITLGGLMISLPIFLQMVLEYNAFTTGLSIAPLSLSMFAVALIAGKKAGKIRPSVLVRTGFLLSAIGIASIIPIVPRADLGISLLIPLLIVGTGLGLLVSQLNNITLSPISGERVSEAAGVNSAAGSFGLSFGLAAAGAVLLSMLAFQFNSLSQTSTVLNPDQKEHVAKGLEEDAQVMSNTQLNELISSQPQKVKDEIISINTKARNQALQTALLVPLIAVLFGFVNSFRMTRLPDPKPAGEDPP
jgi:MFS family permease